VQSICEYLASPSGTIEIHDNATGCNSQVEVEGACGVGIGESSVFSRQSSVIIYPNPSSAIITIELPETASEFPARTTNIVQSGGLISIFNLSGQELVNKYSEGPITEIDITFLPGGLYFVRITSDDTVVVGKFVKE
jgi:hypothetical protein